MTHDLVIGDDGRPRCWWCSGDRRYESYHDSEWGFADPNDNRLYEKICLEGFQAGLSWITILRKRDNFRTAFQGFDLAAVARFGPRHVARLMADPGIVRNRAKIESTINNARRAIELIEEQGTLAKYLRAFQPAPSSRPQRRTRALLETLATTPESTALSRDLKKRGWSFVGPTTLYAFMQSVGLVNDHVDGCHARNPAEQTRHRWRGR